LSQIDTRLTSLGWDADFDAKFIELNQPGAVPARVIADFGADYLVHDGAQTVRARARNVDPAVGDWVALQPGTVTAMVERRTVFTRRAAGDESREQVLAANVDVAFVVAAATDVNVRRIERYLTLAWQGGAVPIVVLTKSDTTESTEGMRAELESVSAGTPVVVTSAVTGEGMDAITGHLQPAKTGVLLGPSGAGKSTLINRIAGVEVMRTREIHRSGEGRHMTSHRQLVQLAQGGMIIDTPGLREAQLWAGNGALRSAFEDIEDLALSCRFTDCAHQTEPGCAIKAALENGSLDQGRLQSYRKLQRELRAIAAKTDVHIRNEERKKWKLISKGAKSHIR
jgi:ribosome biogenesis GTPase